MIDKLKKLGIKITENDSDTKVLFEEDSFVLLSNNNFFIKGYKEKGSYSIPFDILKKTIISYEFIGAKKSIKLSFKNNGSFYYFLLKINSEFFTEIKKKDSHELEFNKIFSILDKYFKERMLIHSKLNIKNDIKIENN